MNEKLQIHLCVLLSEAENYTGAQELAIMTKYLYN